MILAACHAGDALSSGRIAEDKAVFPRVFFQPMLCAAFILVVADINSETQLMLAASGLFDFLVRAFFRFFK